MPLLLVCHSIVIPSFLTHSSNSSIIQVIILIFYLCDFIVILSFLTHSSHSIVIPSFLNHSSHFNAIQSFLAHSVTISSFRCHSSIMIYFGTEGILLPQTPLGAMPKYVFHHSSHSNTIQSFLDHSVNISSFRCHSSIMIYFGTTGTTTQTPLVPCQNIYSVIPDSFQSFG